MANTDQFDDTDVQQGSRRGSTTEDGIRALIRDGRTLEGALGGKYDPQDYSRKSDFRSSNRRKAEKTTVKDSEAFVRKTMHESEHEKAEASQGEGWLGLFKKMAAGLWAWAQPNGKPNDRPE
ncbi:hypothetical protein Moror_16955 [Moniliophthora roreri MCA 2997]|uniref:Uncharacterized protein n=2 Tax=Moniliophthora roreri TaxID=221103 RepID=V2XXV4_MONRO|nr:hypothetical protein Moror_16955 [Moniliophthora roreri MCA 2997]KAI3603260.1 hypothetical protein WG66_002327 [Moniliophthora roreri]